jgi:LysR family transcriptional activator of nhaA
MSFLNYHHLRYFRMIARELSVTRAANKLNLSVPALSLQLKQLEESLGQKLFERSGKGLTLTDAGRIALDYADSIGRAGEELMDVMRHGVGSGQQVLRVGAVATLSRNFQYELLRPLLHRPNIGLVIRSGSLRELLMAMHSHEVDLVLSTEAVRGDSERPWHSHLLADQAVSLVSTPEWKKKRLKFPQDFGDIPIVVPTLESPTREAFDRLLGNIRPRLLAEVDDMAMLRLLAREGEGFALVSPVVVQDEIASGVLVVTHPIPEIHEMFYAITPTRRFPNPLVAELIEKMHTRGMKIPRRRKV